MTTKETDPQSAAGALERELRVVAALESIAKSLERLAGCVAPNEHGNDHVVVFVTGGSITTYAE